MSTLTNSCAQGDLPLVTMTLALESKETKASVWRHMLSFHFEQCPLLIEKTLHIYWFLLELKKKKLRPKIFLHMRVEAEWYTVFSG